ncbi:MAG: Calx-beta domain-containing protein, partial [Crocosphaera sp.]|nr:Calx-beta domain-containing protein [Crocosphaera sp.]
MAHSLSAVVPTVFDSLFDFAQSDGFWDTISIAFGTNYDVTKITEIRTQWQNQEFSQLPEIEVISDGILGNFRGGYAANSNQIYLADSFVETDSSEAILTVLLEEIGHFIDTEVNEVDTAGDEGELFSGLVREYDFSESELTRIQAENDLNYVWFGNNLVALETSEPIILIVDTTVDENDGSADIGEGLSLRDAVSIANESPNTPHIIKLESGVTYELTYISNQETGDRSLNTAGNITIESDGNDYATIVNNRERVPGSGLISGYIINNQSNKKLSLNKISIGNKYGMGIQNNGIITIENSLISDSIDNQGTATLTNNVITDNNVIEKSDIIKNSGDLILDNNTISNNSNLIIDNVGSATLLNNTISNNSRKIIQNFGVGTVTITNNMITDNNLSYGDSLISNAGTIINQGNSILDNNTISNNLGGIIFNSSGSATLINNTITNNTNHNTSGGLIENFIFSDLVLDRNTISENSGSAIIANLVESTLKVANNTINNNHGYSISNSGIATVNDNTINNNDGSGIYNFSGTLTLTDNIITDNAADEGGGIYNYGTLNLTNNNITGNRANGDGGAIYHGSGTLNLTNNSITGNTADGDGGAIYNNRSATLTLTNNSLTGNTADGDGGGIYNNTTATLTLTNNSITGNTANGDGGGIHIDANNGEATLIDNIITGNTAEGKGGGIYNNGTWSSNSTISGNISNEEWYITPEEELTTNPRYYDRDLEKYVDNKLHPTYPDIYDIGDTGSFTELPPSPETSPQPTISISDSWIEIEVNTNQKKLIFEVELSSEHDQSIVVDYYTLDGSASSSERQKDFDKVSNNTLTFLPGETKKQIEITVFGSSTVSDATLELLARDTAYRDWKDTDKGKLIDSIYNYDDLAYEDYRLNEIFSNDTDFNAVGLTADNDFFVVLSNPINAKIAPNDNILLQELIDNKLLQEITNSSGGNNTKAYQDGLAFIVQRISRNQDYTFAKGSIYDQARPPILVIRGTESAQDWFSNASPEGVGYSQFTASKDDINQWLSDVSQSEDNVTFRPHITGHSLGGALTQWVGGSYSGELGKIVTFNAPGISEKNGINLNPSNNQGVKHYITSADIVSMAGSTYLNGVWDLSKYSKLGSAIDFEKHSVPVLNPEILSSGYKKPTDLVTKVPDGNTTDLSDFEFTYLPDADYFALQTTIARLGLLGGTIGGLTGRYIAAALTFRGTAELHREAIGGAIHSIVSASNTIYDSVVSAWNAAKSWTSSAWNSIIEESKEILGLSSTSDFNTQSFEFNPSTQSVNIHQSLIEAQTLNENTITTTNTEPINNFWDAIPLWTDSAWDATTKWTDSAWESITEWTPETWEMTTQWTANDWNIPFLTISNPTVTENDSNNQELVFNVSLSTPSNETITVNYATENGTATLGNDYTSVNGFLTFEPGEINKTITVPILDDNVLEEDETVYLNLSQSTNAHLTDNQATATIINKQMSNQSPTNIQLSHGRIREHESIGTIIGELITTDPDVGDTFTYTLVSGTGSRDNHLFSIDNNQLKLNGTLNYETKNRHVVRVRTTDQDGLFFERLVEIFVDDGNEAALPIIKTPINDIRIVENAPNSNIDLLNHFDDPLSTGKVATFEFYNTDLAGGVVNVLLFDQAENGAPLTVNNFINYVNDNDYDTSIIHRSSSGFVIQGGGFTVNNLFVSRVPADPAVQNEFSRDRSNLRGTIAMAKLGGDPNSATSQWFFNLHDNSANLNNQNGGFTVFGEVLSVDDLAVVDALGSVPVYNGSNINPAFNTLPLQLPPNDTTITNDNQYLRLRDLTVNDFEELTFSVVNNSNPDLVDVSINNNQLVVDYQDEQSGTAEITIRGTSLLGQTIEDTFNINVVPKEQAPSDINLSNNEIAENLATNTLIGNLSSIAPNIESTFDYSLVPGIGATDNSLFTIINDQLRTNAILDYETKNSYSIRLRTTDETGLFYEKVLEVNLLNVNEAPSNLNLTLDKNSYHPSETLDIIGSVIDGDGGEDLAEIDLWLQGPNFTWVNLSSIENFGNDG